MTATLRGVIHEGRIGSIQSGDRRKVRVFAVTSNVIDEDPDAVKDAVGVEYLDAFSFAAVDSGCLAESFTAEVAPGKNPYLWHVTIEYTSKGLNPAEWNTDPLQRRWRLRMSSEKFKKPAPRDVHGIAKRNSAGELLEGLEKDDGRQVLEWELNTDESYLDTIFSAKDAVNNSEWNGKASLTLKVDDIRAEPMFENGQEYYHVWLRFHHDEDGWTTKVLDRGFHYLEGSPATIKRFRDKQGNPTPEPQFLNGVGAKLADSQTTLNGAITAAQVTFNVTSIASFAGVPRPFYVEIDDEVLKVTDTGTTFFIAARAQKGTTAAAHSNGATILLSPVELEFTDYPRFEYSLFNIA